MKKLIVVLLMVGSVITASAQKAKTASIIFKEYLDAVSRGDSQAAASYFAENGYIEAPYVASFGMPPKFEGRQAIAATMDALRKNAPNFHFTSCSVVMETPDQVVAEYQSEALLANGRQYNMSYIGVIITKDGKIISHKEYLNTVPFAEAFLPNGLKDLIK